SVHQLNQRASQNKIKTDKCQQRRRIVEHSSGCFFDLASLLDEIGFQNFSQTSKTVQGLDHEFQRRTPRQRRRRYFTENRLYDLGDVCKLDALVINLGRCAERKVLHQQKVDFVAVEGGLRWFAQVSFNQRLQAALAGVHGGRLQKMAQLVDQHTLVHGVQPGLN